MATDDYFLVKSKMTFIWQIFFLNCSSPRNGAVNYYFDSAIRNRILSVHYQIREGDFAETWGGQMR